MSNGYPFDIWQGGVTSPVDPLKDRKNFTFSKTRCRYIVNFPVNYEKKQSYAQRVPSGAIALWCNIENNDENRLGVYFLSQEEIGFVSQLNSFLFLFVILWIKYPETEIFSFSASSILDILSGFLSVLSIIFISSRPTSVRNIAFILNSVMFFLFVFTNMINSSSINWPNSADSSLNTDTRGAEMPLISPAFSSFKRSEKFLDLYSLGK